MSIQGAGVFVMVAVGLVTRFVATICPVKMGCAGLHSTFLIVFAVLLSVLVIVSSFFDVACRGSSSQSLSSLYDVAELFVEGVIPSTVQRSRSFGTVYVVISVAVCVVSKVEGHYDVIFVTWRCLICCSMVFNIVRSLLGRFWVFLLCALLSTKLLDSIWQCHVHYVGYNPTSYLFQFTHL